MVKNGDSRKSEMEDTNVENESEKNLEEENEIVESASPQTFYGHGGKIVDKVGTEKLVSQITKEHSDTESSESENEPLVVHVQKNKNISSVKKKAHVPPSHIDYHLPYVENDLHMFPIIRTYWD